MNTYTWTGPNGDTAWINLDAILAFRYYPESEHTDGVYSGLHVTVGGDAWHLKGEEADNLYKVLREVKGLW